MSFPDDRSGTLVLAPLPEAVRASADRVLRERRLASRRAADALLNAPVMASADALEAAETASVWPMVAVAVLSFSLGALTTYWWNRPVREPAPVVVRPVVITAPAAMAAEARAPAGVQPDATVARAGVERLVRDWAAAWSARDADRYLSHYAAEFTPPDRLTRADWETRRRQRIAGKKSIEIRADDVEVILMQENRAMVRFLQTYEADGRRESRVPKTLVVVREQGEWKIAAEASSR